MRDESLAAPKKARLCLNRGIEQPLKLGRRCFPDQQKTFEQRLTLLDQLLVVEAEDLDRDLAAPT